MTPNVSVRPYEQMELDEIAAAVRESLPELSQWFPWAHPEYSAKDAAEWVRATVVARAAGSAHDFAIVVVLAQICDLHDRGHGAYFTGSPGARLERSAGH